MNKNALYVVLFLGLGGYYGYDTLYPEYEKAGTEIIELDKKLAEARAMAPQLATLKREEQELKERLNASLAKLPSGAELANLLVLIMPIMEDVGITSSQVERRNIANPIEQQVYRTHPIQIGGIKNVSMSTVLQLLHQIRNFDRIINVKRATLAKTANDRYTLDLDLETYSYIESEEDLGLETTEEVAPEIETEITVDTEVADTAADTAPPAVAADDTETEQAE